MGFYSSSRTRVVILSFRATARGAAANATLSSNPISFKTVLDK